LAQHVGQDMLWIMHLQRLSLPGELTPGRGQVHEQVQGSHQNSSTSSGGGMGAGGSVRSHWASGQPVFVA
jgi:hypothetical protein